ncbi:GntR family transcriptional regulator, partial [Klebsiella pneumoniae]|uniref:GntR family transcriptional regulator n=1 Tax=Klebsiella pneumoniae TaxID=573 RepID=UPI0027301B6F
MPLPRHPPIPPPRYQKTPPRLEQGRPHPSRGGTYLPAGQQRATRFDVNRHTLRRAIDQLVERGWVQRRQGVGVLVLMRP